MTNSITVRRTRESDWQEYRDLRLEMLGDTPEAFGETLENARGWDEGEWRMRAARGEASDQILVAAIEESNGRWIGSMGGFIASGPTLALAFYQRSGYRLTGKVEPYALGPNQRELEMVKELR